MAKLEGMNALQVFPQEFSFVLLQVAVSLLVLLAGVGLATIEDVHLGYFGGGLALLTVFMTAAVTSATHLLQRKYELSSDQASFTLDFDSTAKPNRPPNSSWLVFCQRRLV